MHFQLFLSTLVFEPIWDFEISNHIMYLTIVMDGILYPTDRPPNRNPPPSWRGASQHPGPTSQLEARQQAPSPLAELPYPPLNDPHFVFSGPPKGSFRRGGHLRMLKKFPGHFESIFPCP